MSKLVETMAKNSAEEVPTGVIAQMWDVIMELDKDGSRLLKDEAKNRKQREREKRKKATAKAKKRAKKGVEALKTGESKEGEAGRDRLIRRLHLVQRHLGRHQLGRVE